MPADIGSTHVAPDCVLCNLPTQPEERYLCTCARHVLHTNGECLDQWVASQWGLFEAGGCSIAECWVRVRGCPICAGARPLDVADVVDLLPRLARGTLQRTVAAAVRAAEGTVQTPEPSRAESQEGEHAHSIRRLTEELQDFAVLRCPSCRKPFEIDPDRGCDAVWCQHQSCRRAFCLWCLRDCGDHVGATGGSSHGDGLLVGDAHDHVKHNDCGLTGGRLFSGDDVVKHHLKRSRLEMAVRLRRVHPNVRERVCAALGLEESEVLREPQDTCGSANAVAESTPSQDRTKIRTLLCAAYHGDAPRICALLDSRVDPNSEDENGTGLTAIHFAASKGHVQIIEELLIRSMDPDLRDKQGMTPLHHVANVNGCGSLEVARVLVRARWARNFKQGEPCGGAKMNGGSTVAAFARLYGHGGLVRYFERMRSDGPKLLGACFHGSAEQVRQLLGEEADMVHYRDVENGCTGLHFACKAPAAPAVPIISLLLEHRADARSREPHNGRTPLHFLTMEGGCGSVEAARLLVNSRADPCAQDWAFVTPLQCCNDNGRSALAEHLSASLTR